MIQKPITETRIAIIADLSMVELEAGRVVNAHERQTEEGESNSISCYESKKKRIGHANDNFWTRIKAHDGRKSCCCNYAIMDASEHTTSFRQDRGRGSGS